MECTLKDLQFLFSPFENLLLCCTRHNKNGFSANLDIGTSSFRVLFTVFDSLWFCFCIYVRTIIFWNDRGKCDIYFTLAPVMYNTFAPVAHFYKANMMHAIVNNICWNLSTERSVARTFKLPLPRESHQNYSLNISEVLISHLP